MRPPGWTRPVVRVIATGVIAAATLAMVGHAAGEDRLMTWGLGGTPMPFSSSTCLFLVGCALYLIAWGDE
jgi:hypothetical protein